MSMTELASDPTEQMTGHPEHQYLALMRRIRDTGVARSDRTGTGTRALFGAQMRFDLADGFPALTTKRVAWKTAIREMLWFLSGSTNIRPLVEQGVHIWTDWPLARFRSFTGKDISMEKFEEMILEDELFAIAWGDLGPVYGKQWTRWGAGEATINQIDEVIRLLREDPTSRRILFTGWNVAELDLMALPPCHMTYQFFVADGRLSCILYQRSADLFLGVPFNIVGASALTLMLAGQCNLEPGEFIWMGADVHLYANHMEAVAEQLQRPPRSLAQMTLMRKPASIYDYRIEDFRLDGYTPHTPISAPVAV